MTIQYRQHPGGHRPVRAGAEREKEPGQRHQKPAGHAHRAAEVPARPHRGQDMIHRQLKKEDRGRRR